MKPRLPFDDAAWEKSEEVEESWLNNLFDENIYNEIGLSLEENNKPRQWTDFKLFRTGGFNASFLMTFTNTNPKTEPFRVETETDGSILRFPITGAHMFPEEKVRNEVFFMKFIQDRSLDFLPIPIPIPKISRWGERNESPSNLGPFIIMDYIKHEQSMSDLLEKPGRQPKQRPELNPDIDIATLKSAYRELANIVFSLSILSANKIGSLSQNEDSEWEVIHRPLSMSMNQIVQLGTVPRSEIPTAIYEKASLYFETLANLQISHLKHQRNDAIDSEDDCRRKFIARFLFRKIIRDRNLRDKWLSLNYENGPFPIWCDDLRPQNVMIDEDGKVVGVVDWEFTYTAPVEFSNAPPWWILLERPEYWSKGLDDWCEKYAERLEVFLQAMEDCEEDAGWTHGGPLGRRHSNRMRDSWESGDFWIMYAARNNFAFDAIYWKKIDQRFFGVVGDGDDICDVWKKRLDLLQPEERNFINECVELKLRESETRLLSWDPDRYTREYMAKMET